ncbi:LysR family transcriptional regulator [Gordonia hydrophobica]|uniref:LysR family transcriptional regulator n=1 Tax=Gordonia hydrophobica TaxID=40516 RepID=A0ABZ2U6V2_9ACTN|nr:LysR family transcriptional regulator [Gordonia hydrophobica]MBM7368277.1 DNA-binding transcriptional LysR family regulator [Gordonia hydrophobica]
MDLRSLDLGALQLLVGVDDHGSLSAAARALGTAQPNASRAIGRLERQLGVRLLERVTTGSRLTPDGTVLVHFARRIVESGQEMLTVAAGLHGDTAAEITVDASMTVAEHLMPLWLGTFRSEHAGTTVHLRMRNSTEVFETVSAGTCDVGFVESPTVPRGLHSAVVARDQLVVIVPPGHKWARRRRPIDVAELAATPLLEREPGSGTRTTLENALGDLERATPVLELGSSAAIRTAVAGGVGPAVLSTLAVAESARSGELRVVHVDGLNLRRELRAVWRPPRTLQGPAAELVRIARRSAQ